MRTTKRLQAHLLLLVVLIAVLTVMGCTNESADQNPQQETAISGTAEVLCDEQIKDLMSASKGLFDSAHPKAHVTLRAIDAEAGIDALLRHKARAIVVARDWLPSEDTITREIENSTGFPRTMIARDALVFYAAKSFPYDTMHADHISSFLANGVFDRASYPLLKKQPLFVVPGSNSSVYGNVVNVVCKRSIPAKGTVASMGTFDSTLMRVRAGVNLIGIGYLSQMIGDTSVKLLRLSYTDSTGAYETPKPVHASYLIMGKYPFPVPIYVVLRDRANQYSLPSGYMLYLARDGKAQRTFFDAGIEPGYAKIELILPEE